MAGGGEDRELGTDSTTWSKAMKLFCQKCGVVLTKELNELSDLSRLSEEDDKDYLPAGFFFRSDGSYFTGSEGKVIINLNDLLNAQNHHDPTRLNGCCGLDGASGINKVCVNGHEIGTAKEDCWMPHCVIMEPKLLTEIH